MTGEDYRIDVPGITSGVSVTPISVFTPITPTVISKPDDLSKVGIFEITLPDNIISQTKLDGVTPADLISPGGIDTSVPGRVKITSGDLAGLELDFTGFDPGQTYTYRVVVDNKLGVFGSGKETFPGSGEYVVYDPTDTSKDKLEKGIFDALFALRDSLNSGDHRKVNDCINDIQEKTDQLLQRRVGIGSRTRHFEALRDQMLDLEVKLRDVEQNLDGADMYKLSIMMSEEQVTYEASLAAGAKIMQVSLLNFLK